MKAGPGLAPFAASVVTHVCRRGSLGVWLQPQGGGWASPLPLGSEWGGLLAALTIFFPTSGFFYHSCTPAVLNL